MEPAKGLGNEARDMCTGVNLEAPSSVSPPIPLRHWGTHRFLVFLARLTANNSPRASCLTVCLLWLLGLPDVSVWGHANSGSDSYTSVLTPCAVCTLHPHRLESGYVSCSLSSEISSVTHTSSPNLHPIPVIFLITRTHFLLGVSGRESRPSHMLGKSSTTQPCL